MNRALMLLAAFFAGSIFGGAIVRVVVLEYRYESPCTRIDGRLDRRNDRTVIVPVTCSPGCALVVDEHEWRCVGVRVEVPR